MKQFKILFVLLISCAAVGLLAQSCGEEDGFAPVGIQITGAGN